MKKMTVLKAISEYRDPYNTPSDEAFDLLSDLVYDEMSIIFRLNQYDNGLNDEQIDNLREDEWQEFIHEQLERLLNPVYEK